MIRCVSLGNKSAEVIEEQNILKLSVDIVTVDIIISLLFKKADNRFFKLVLGKFPLFKDIIHVTYLLLFQILNGQSNQRQTAVEKVIIIIAVRYVDFIGFMMSYSEIVANIG